MTEGFAQSDAQQVMKECKVYFTGTRDLALELVPVGRLFGVWR